METDDHASIHKLSQFSEDLFCSNLDVIIEEEMPDILQHQFDLDLQPTHKYCKDKETQLLSSEIAPGRLANEYDSLDLFHNQTNSHDHDPNMSCVDSRKCNLPGNDCIKKSILYSNVSERQDAGVDDKLPVIYSDSSSSSTDYPLNNASSLDEGTYSVLEELPSDSISNQTDSTHEEGRSLKMLLQCYSNSFSESEEHPGRPNSNKQDVYRYFRKCFEATEKIERMNASNKIVYEDVVEKVINQYRNLRVKMDSNSHVMDPKTSTTSTGWFSLSDEHSSSSDEGKFCAIVNTAGKWPSCDSSSFDISSSIMQSSPENFFNNTFSSSDMSDKSFPNTSHAADVISKQQDFYLDSCQGYAEKQLSGSESSLKDNLLDMILEPPDMFKSEEKQEFAAMTDKSRSSRVVERIHQEDPSHRDSIVNKTATAQDYQIKSSTDPLNKNIAFEVSSKHMPSKDVSNTESNVKIPPQNRSELLQNNLVTADELLFDDILVYPCINSYHNLTHLVDCEDKNSSDKILASTCRLNFSLLIKEYLQNISESKLKLFDLAAHSRCHNWSHTFDIPPPAITYAMSVIRSIFPSSDVVLGYGDQNHYYCSSRKMQHCDAESDKLGMPPVWSLSDGDKWFLSEANCINGFSIDPCPKLHALEFVVAPQLHEKIGLLVEPEENSSSTPADVTNRVNSSQDKPVTLSTSLNVSNIEAIGKLSDYLKKSLETKCEDNVTHASDSRPKAELDASTEQITSFVFSSSSCSSSSDISDDENNTPHEGDMSLEKTLLENGQVSRFPRVGILKSTKSKKDKKKHNVHFDESMNEFFDANYVIVFHDESYNSSGDCDDYETCKCGDEFCCEQAYQDEENFQFQVDGSQVNCAPTLFTDPIPSDQPQNNQAECGLDLEQETPVNVITHTHYENANEGAPMESQKKLWTDTVTFDKKWESADPATATDSCHVMKADPQNLGYPFQSKNNSSGSQPAMFNDISESSDHLPRYIIGAIHMTTLSNIGQQPAHNLLKLKNVLADNNNNANDLLKTDKLWYHQDMASLGVGNLSTSDILLNNVNKMVSFDEKCRVEFLPDHFDEDAAAMGPINQYNCGDGDFTLTFKMGNRMVPCNSLKPNSAVRQLFPDPRFVNSCMSKSKVDCSDRSENKYPGKYLVTEESLKAFNEVNKRSVFTSFRGQEGGGSQDDGNMTSRHKNEAVLQNDFVRKTINQNSLRRRLFRYPDNESYYPSGASSNLKKKSEISLEERIKQLTCNLDDDKVANNVAQTKYIISEREKNHKNCVGAGNTTHPTSAVKLVGLYHTVERKANNNHQSPACYQPVYQTSELDPCPNTHSNISVPAKKACEQFVASVAPSYNTSYDSSNYISNDRLDRTDDSSQLNINGTGTADTSHWNDSDQDELVMFVQQDARRIERIRQRYITSGIHADIRSSNNNEFNRDDNGFNDGHQEYSSVVPLGSAMSILQHIQQLSYYQVSSVSPNEPSLKEDGINNSNVQKLCYVPSNYVNKKTMYY